MSFASKIVQSGSTPVHFITCKDPDGRDCYYFVLATREKIQMLKEIKIGTFNINDYGKIIESGYGLKPPAEVIKQLSAEYGIDASKF